MLTIWAISLKNTLTAPEKADPKSQHRSRKRIIYDLDPDEMGHFPADQVHSKHDQHKKGVDEKGGDLLRIGRISTLNTTFFTR